MSLAVRERSDRLCALSFLWELEPFVEFLSGIGAIPSILAGLGAGLGQSGPGRFEPRSPRARGRAQTGYAPLLSLGIGVVRTICTGNWTHSVNFGRSWSHF